MTSRTGFGGAGRARRFDRAGVFGPKARDGGIACREHPENQPEQSARGRQVIFEQDTAELHIRVADDRNKAHPSGGKQAAQSIGLILLGGCGEVVAHLDGWLAIA